jgi:hypothetical protein
MKKKLLVLLGIGLGIGILCVSTLVGCQSVTKNLGGEMTIELESNQKLEMITWKDSSLWYLTKPMTDDDVAETHLFQQSSEFGVFEGTVTVIETKG